MGKRKGFHSQLLDAVEKFTSRAVVSSFSAEQSPRACYKCTFLGPQAFCFSSETCCKVEPRNLHLEGPQNLPGDLEHLVPRLHAHLKPQHRAGGPFTNPWARRPLGIGEQVKSGLNQQMSGGV